MDRILKYIFLLAILAILPSCEDFMDVHKEWIENGETVYSVKLDSLQAYGGNQRVKLKMWLYNAPNVKTIDIFYNDRMDSINIDVNLGTDMDSVEYIINNLEEKSYTFDVRTTDIFGNKSLWLTNFGTAYGEIYTSLKNQRRIKEVTRELLLGKIYMFSAPEELVYTEVEYVDNAGKKTNIIVSNELDVMQCPNVQPGSTFRYRSIYAPEEEAIDVFYLDWIEGTFPQLDARTLASTFIENGEANFLFDDSPSGFLYDEIKYTSLSGEEKIAKFDDSKKLVSISDIDVDKPFYTRSTFQLTDDETNTNTTEWFEGQGFEELDEHKIYRNNWSVLEVSDETASDGGGMHTVLDGNLGTYWHSQWDPDDAPLPHWIIIDLGKPYSNITAVEAYRRPGNKDAAELEIYFSDSPDPDGTWTLAGTINFGTTDNSQNDFASPITTKRYMKAIVTKSNRDPFSSIAEIYLIGK